MQFQVRRLIDYSRDSLLEELRRVVTLLGQSDLTQSTFRQHSRVSPSTVRRCFGTWEASLIEAGILASAPARLSPIQAAAELTRVATMLPQDGKLTILFFKLNSTISPKLIIGQFGTWRLALQAANLENNFDARSQKIPRNQIIDELQRVATLLKTRQLTRQQFEEHSNFGAKAAAKEFGSWHEAARAAGFAGSPQGEPKTDEDCFDNLLTVWTHYGRQPTQREMSQLPSQIGAHVYERRFGGWIKSLEVFATRIREDVVQQPLTTSTTISGAIADQSPDQTESPPPATSRAPTRLSESDRREIRLGLRYNVLSRDRFRCVICGRSPATTLGIVLHVDHIVAWSRGGKTVFANLRTACSDCNLGKGAREEA